MKVVYIRVVTTVSGSPHVYSMRLSHMLATFQQVTDRGTEGKRWRVSCIEDRWMRLRLTQGASISDSICRHFLPMADSSSTPLIDATLVKMYL